MTNRIFSTAILMNLLIYGTHPCCASLKVGVYCDQYPSAQNRQTISELIDRINKHKGIEAREIKTIGKQEIIKHDVILFCAPRRIPKKPLMASYIHSGYSVLMTYHPGDNHGPEGYQKKHEPALYSDVAKISGKGDKSFVVTDKAHPVTKGLSARFRSSSAQYVQLKAGASGTSLIRDEAGKDIVVAAQIGKGKVLAIGNVFHKDSQPSQGTKEQKPLNADEIKLLINAITWLAQDAPKNKEWQEKKTWFVDIAKQAGVDYWGHGKCVCFGDIDNDGFLDLFLSIARAPNKFFHNNRDSTFSDITDKIRGGDGDGSAYGAVIADINNTGMNDLLVASKNRHNANTKYFPQGLWHPNRLYLNHSSIWGDVAQHAGIALQCPGKDNADGSKNTTTAISVGDIDNDGNLDIYFANYCTPRNYLFRQKPLSPHDWARTGVSFEDITEKSGVAIYKGHFSVSSLVDIDSDGYLDLYTAELRNPKAKYIRRIFHNNGDGTFAEVTETSGLSQEGENVTGAFGDFNNDGFIDLCIGGLRGKAGSEMFLYQNNGDGTFKDVTKSSKLREVSGDAFETRGVVWGDMDNDGFLDLYVAGSPERLLRNNGNGTFSRIPAVISGLSASHGHGCNFGDIDNDGKLDLFVSNWFSPMDSCYKHPDAGRFCLFHNEIENGNNYLKVLVKGRKGGTNLSGVGAKIYVYKAGHCGDRKYLAGYREVRAGRMFTSGPLIQHFGLGQEKKVDIEVVYPATGKTVKRTGVLCDQTITIKE